MSTNATTQQITSTIAIQQDSNCYIDRAPKMVLINIFKFVPPIELTANCMIVCKKWNQIIKLPFFDLARFSAIFIQYALKNMKLIEIYDDQKIWKEILLQIAYFSPEFAKKIIETINNKIPKSAPNLKAAESITKIKLTISKLMFAVEKLEGKGSYENTSKFIKLIPYMQSTNSEKLKLLCNFRLQRTLEQILKNNGQDWNIFSICLQQTSELDFDNDKFLYKAAISVIKENEYSGLMIRDFIGSKNLRFNFDVKTGFKNDNDVDMIKNAERLIEDFDLRFDALLSIAEKEGNFEPLFTILNELPINLGENDPYYLKIIPIQTKINSKAAEETLNHIYFPENKAMGMILWTYHSGNKDYSKCFEYIKNIHLSDCEINNEFDNPLDTKVGFLLGYLSQFQLHTDPKEAKKTIDTMLKFLLPMHNRIEGLSLFIKASSTQWVAFRDGFFKENQKK